jgi:hypothetical protein
MTFRPLSAVAPEGVGTLFNVDADNAVIIETAAMTALCALMEERRPDMFNRPSARRGIGSFVVAFLAQCHSPAPFMEDRS